MHLIWGKKFIIIDKVTQASYSKPNFQDSVWAHPQEVQIREETT